MTNYNYVNALSYYLQWKSKKHPTGNWQGSVALESVNLDEVMKFADFLNKNESEYNAAHNALSMACSYATGGEHVENVLNATERFFAFIKTETPASIMSTALKVEGK